MAPGALEVPDRGISAADQFDCVNLVFCKSSPFVLKRIIPVTRSIFVQVSVGNLSLAT